MIIENLEEKLHFKELVELFKDAGAKTYFDKYSMLQVLTVEISLKKNKFSPKLRKQIKIIYNDMHEIYASCEREIQKQRIFVICSKCNKKRMMHMEDKRKERLSIDVKPMCFQCRPKPVYNYSSK